MTNQQFPVDGSILTTKDGKPVFSTGASESPAYTTEPEKSAYCLHPVTARKAYGILNNRATKREAEKELNEPLFWA